MALSYYISCKYHVLFAAAGHQGVIAHFTRGLLVTGLEFGCAVQADIKSLKQSIECSTLFSPTHARHAFFIEGFFSTGKTVLGHPGFLNGKEGQPTSFFMNLKGQHVNIKFEL